MSNVRNACAAMLQGNGVVEGRPEMARRLEHLRAAVAMLILAWASSAAYGADIVNAALQGPNIDLLPVLQFVESRTPEATIEIPAAGGGEKGSMKLRSASRGTLHRWVVFTLSNPGTTPQELILAVPHQGFVGSGLMRVASSGSLVTSIQASVATDQLRKLNVLGSDAVTLTVEPGATATYAIGLASAGLRSVTLWKRGAFNAQSAEFAFFRGVILGIALLLGIAIVCLFVVRSRAVFPAAALFAWSSVAFIALDAGYFSAVSHLLPGEDGAARASAIIESLMLAGLIACLITFVELRKRSAVLGILFIMMGGGALALSVYGWFQPHLVSAIARIGFATVAVAGFAIVFGYWRAGAPRAQASLLPWSVLLAWTVVAAAGALDIFALSIMKPLITAGLVMVLVTMSFTLAQFAFNQSSGSPRFFEDSGRRALALAGSEQSVWDWQVELGELYVGPELERTLGVVPGSVSGTDLKSWMGLIHPADRSAYVGAVEAAERRGRGTFSQDFRLRRSDGSYRWFLLRARTVVDEDGNAVRLIGTMADITSVKRSEERILSDAVRDRITGLPNRALLLDRLDRAMLRARDDNNLELYVLVIDLDRFKNVNDGLGHEVGDSLLNVAGRRLSQLLGPQDTLARLPGDQFAIIFNGAKPQRDIIPFGESIRKALSEPIQLKPREILITASVGVTHYRIDRERAEDLLKDAEIALHEAKRRGKDKIEFFRSHMRDERSQLVTLEQDLRRALERDEIEVVYQPIMRLQDRQLAGFEALVRWRHPKQGLLGPGSFMGVAEETGLIRDIGRHVLNEAARQLGIWQRAFRQADPLFVSVNVSSVQLLDNKLLEEVRNLLSREDIQDGTLKLELTETMVMQNPELSAKMLERIRQLGIGLACDDFGTGYSALANLRRLPFDTLKVDKSFVDVDYEDERASIILETIILLAHDLDLTVVAEGIENEEQIERLTELECDYGQGYFIGQPVTARDVIEVIGQPYGQGARADGETGLLGRLFGRKAPPAADRLPALPETQPPQLDEAAAATAPELQEPAHDDSARQQPAEQPPNVVDEAPQVAQEHSAEALPWPPVQWPDDEGEQASAQQAAALADPQPHAEPALEPETVTAGTVTSDPQAPETAEEPPQVGIAPMAPRRPRHDAASANGGGLDASGTVEAKPRAKPRALGEKLKRAAKTRAAKTAPPK